MRVIPFPAGLEENNISVEEGGYVDLVGNTWVPVYLVGRYLAGWASFIVVCLVVCFGGKRRVASFIVVCLVVCFGGKRRVASFIVVCLVVCFGGKRRVASFIVVCLVVCFGGKRRVASFIVVCLVVCFGGKRRVAKGGERERERHTHTHTHSLTPSLQRCMTEKVAVQQRREASLRPCPEHLRIAGPGEIDDGDGKKHWHRWGDIAQSALQCLYIHMVCGLGWAVLDCGKGSGID